MQHLESIIIFYPDVVMFLWLNNLVWLVNWPVPDSGARTDLVCWSHQTLSSSLGLVKGRICQTNCAPALRGRVKEQCMGGLQHTRTLHLGGSVLVVSMGLQLDHSQFALPLV